MNIINNTSVSSTDNSNRLTELKSSITLINSEHLSFQDDHQILSAEFQQVITGAIQHSKQKHAIQSDMLIISSMILEIRSALLPNAPPIPPRSVLSSMSITDDLSSLKSTPAISNTNYSPRRKAPIGYQLASPSQNLMTGDSQIMSGIGSRPRECEMSAPSGLEQY
jgi:hypothetical protein